MMYYSQHGQDKYLDEHVFQGKRGGVFVEIGAHNGEAFSNTCFLERERDWTGILFEPIPKCFNELLTKRKCLAMNVCVSDREGEEEFLIADGWVEMLSGMTRAYDPAHVKRIDSEIVEYGGSKRIAKVQSVLLDKTLVEKGLTNVDYCSIDTEGSELTILKSIDFSKVAIQCFTVENNYSDKRIESFMQSKGYIKKASFGTDDLYMRNV